MSVRSHRIFVALRPQVLRHLDSFTPQHVANLTWALATVRHIHPPTMAALDSAIPRVLPAATTQHV
eukprot:CAMPEP_0204372022 /NCGR_PEP_ID=MMETSP0469-20131031/46951_1 /ASSEMBLY_ACC=CAM_ASM_000384 /TAXON_ID=2969 /ORGANISM="Oxyrrhis marina" /LENGTH=65 /DNA_ID=CAMNT_0051362239 /DNA_START=38 /DNA_END=232 /DNA_ORIENTATION=-